MGCLSFLRLGAGKRANGVSGARKCANDQRECFPAPQKFRFAGHFRGPLFYAVSSLSLITSIGIGKRLPLAGIFIDQCAVSSLSLITNVGKWKRLRKQKFTLTNMLFPAPKLMWQRHIYFCKSKNKNNDICRCLSFGADGGNRTRDLCLTKAVLYH